MITGPGQFVLLDGVEVVASCLKLRSFELGCKRAQLCPSPILFAFARRLTEQLPPNSRSKLVIDLGVRNEAKASKSPSSMGYVPNPSEWLLWFHDQQAIMDEWATMHVHLRILTFRVPTAHVGDAARRAFPRAIHAGKLQVEVK